MCSIIGVGERLHKVLGQIDLGTMDSGEQSLPFGLLVTEGLQVVKRQVPSLYHCKIVARLYHDQKSLSLDRLYCNSMQEQKKSQKEHLSCNIYPENHQEAKKTDIWPALFSVYQCALPTLH